jgi:hypothetical protein
MNKLITSYKILYFFALIAIVSTYYWSFRYYIEVDNPIRSEFLVGESFIILYFIPVWLGLILVSIVGRKFLTKPQIFMAFIPAFLILLPLVIRSVIYQA